MVVFEKKIIIGSVVGFVASAVGLIAVFFPSVFNLEKKSIAEKSMVLYTPKSAHDLINWLEKQENNIVKIDIAYCLGNASESEDYESTQSYYFGEKINGNLPFKLSANYYEDAESGGVIYLSGGISLPSNDELLKEQGIHTLISIGSSDKEADYLWSDNVGKSTAYQDAEKICPTSKSIWTGEPIIQTGVLQGVFYVNKPSLGADYVNQGGQALNIDLDAMSKKALQLCNY